MRFLCLLSIGLVVLNWIPLQPEVSFEWKMGKPEDQGMSSERLAALQDDLVARGTTGFLVIRNDTIVHEWYADGYGRTSKHYTASMAKALVGGVSLSVAISDQLVSLDDRVARFVQQWRRDPAKTKITVRHLGSHTSGLENAVVASEAAAGVRQDDFSGWQGDFWRWRSMKTSDSNDAFTISRDLSPLLFPPGSDYHYSNPGIAMLSYVVAASLSQEEHNDLRTLLRERVMRPIGVPDDEWSCGYGKTEMVDGLPIVASWGGGSYSANATARVARLMLREGNWEGNQLISAHAVSQTVTDAGTPNSAGMGWWTNSEGDFGKAPSNSFSGQGAGHQVVLVVPELNLICVRNGSLLSPDVEFRTALRQFLFDPLMNAVLEPDLQELDTIPYPRSPVIQSVQWAPKEEIVRKAEGGDNWPITWADDDLLYTAYGDGWGFEPFVPNKLSMGFASVKGGPTDFEGTNIRSATGERVGQGPEGKKVSGMLMVDATLYMLVRNAENSQLAWSEDYGKTWEWSEWRFTNSFGYPTFLNFGKNYAGARDNFVYIYSHNSDSAYEKSDSMVMARVPKDRIRDRSAYVFFRGIDYKGEPYWSRRIEERGAVFSHPGHCYRIGISYNAGLKRYLWCHIHPESEDSRGPRFQGGFGIYDAPEPWGPWTTVYFSPAWDVGPGETSSFPTKWMSKDGKTVHLVFSGDDFFSVRKARLALRANE
jgi:CubicO group peptidase (beta-lactamase class C family)